MSQSRIGRAVIKGLGTVVGEVHEDGPEPVEDRTRQR